MWKKNMRVGIIHYKRENHIKEVTEGNKEHIIMNEHISENKA